MVRLKVCAFVAAFSALLCGKAWAQTTITWTGYGDTTNWSDTNWSPEPSGFGSYAAVFNLGTLESGVTTVSTVDNPDAIVSVTVTGTNGGFGLALNSTGGSTLTIGTSLTINTSDPVTINVPLLGSGSVTSNGVVFDDAGIGGVLTLTGANQYTGGTFINLGTLVVGSSSTGGVDLSVVTGPVGTGTLTMNNGTNLTTPDTNTYSVGNSIFLGNGNPYSSSNFVTVLGGSVGGNLVLGGTISGPAGLQLPAGTDGTNTLTLTSPFSTFSGGVSLGTGSATLVVGASSSSDGEVYEGPLGTGTLMLSNGNNFTTPGNDTSYEVDNAITLCGGGTITLMGDTEGYAYLTLGGTITGSSALELASGLDGNNYLALTSPNSTFSGGLTVDEGPTTLAVGASSFAVDGVVQYGPLGTGTLTLNTSNNLTTTGGTQEIDNAITLLSTEGGNVNMFEGYSDVGLTLTGTIGGPGGLTVYSSYDSLGNTLTLTSPSSTFGGGVQVLSGNTTLVVGASSTSSDGVVTQGPLGTGTLMLSSGNNFTTTGTSCFEIDNEITLCGGGTVTLLGDTASAMLTLGGNIYGYSTLEVAAGTDGNNSLTLTSPYSTFSGGVRVDSGNTTLAIGASSSSDGEVYEGPLGTGTLMLSNGNNFTTTGSGPFEIDNEITLCGGGTVTLLGNNPGATLTLGGEIYGSAAFELAAGTDGSNTLVLTSPYSTFSGGVRVDSGNTTLVVGASSSSEGSVYEGPLGTGTLMLSNGNNFTTTGTSCFEIDNEITLCGGGTVTLLGDTASAMLTLGGSITGYSTLEVAAGTDGSNSLTLTSPYSTFSGGVRVDPGNTTLAVGASSSSDGEVYEGPLGTGTLMLSNGNTFTTTGDGTYTIGNDITLCGGGTVYLLGGNYNNTLTLTGTISGSSALELNSPGEDGSTSLNLTSPFSTFTGGVRVEPGYTSLAVGASSSSDGSVYEGPLGTGTLMLSNGNNFTTTDSSCYTIGNNITLCGGGTVYLLYVNDNPMLTLSGAISGGSAIEVASSSTDGGSEYRLDLTSAASTFSGGISVDEGNTILAVGASSTGTGSGVTAGPLGTGTLMLSNGNDFTTTGSECFTIGNNITLCDGGTVTLLGGTMGSMLTLTGMISGGSTLEVANAGCGGTNILTLTSGCSTFSGGVIVDAGTTTLVVGASGNGPATDFSEGPLGTGSLSLGSGTTLAPSADTQVTLPNALFVGSSVALGNGNTGGSLTLLGTVGDLSGPGSLVINGTIDLEGVNTYSGGTSLSDGSTLYVGNSSSLGTGALAADAFAVAPVLAPSPLGGSVSIPNNIVINATGLVLNTPGATTTLTLSGVISDFDSFDPLTILGPVTLNGNNTYSGGTTITNVTNAGGVTVGTDTGLGTGPVNSIGSLLNFLSSAPSLTYAVFDTTTANFAGSPVLTDLSLTSSTLNFNGPSADVVDMYSDNPGSTNAINLGEDTALTFHVSNGNETDYYGTITGATGSLVVNGAGLLNLGGANTYGGGTSVTNGLLVAGSNTAFGSGPVSVTGVGALGMSPGVTVENTVDFTSGAIGGYGTFAPTALSTFDFQGGSVVTAGRGLLGVGGSGGPPVQGMLTFGPNTSVVFGPNGVYDFAIQNSGAGAVAGTDYSTLALNGAFSITATSSNPFTINLLSVTPSGSLGEAVINADQSYTWTLLTTSTPISSFNAADFTISTSLFTYNLGTLAPSQFSITEGAGDTSLVLNFTPVPEPSTWMLMASGLCALGTAVRRRRR